MRLTNDTPGAHFPVGILGVGLNRSAVASHTGSSGFLARETTTIDDAFTVELFANFDNLDDTADRSVLAAQAEFPCCLRSWASGFSWAFVVERQGANIFPGGTSQPRELELFASDGTDIWLIPSGIILAEGRDYYLSAAFDVGANVRFYAKDLLTDHVQIVSAQHSVSQVLAYDTLGVMWPEQWSHVDGIIDEVRLSEGMLSEEELLVNNQAAGGDFNVNGMLDVDDVSLLTTYARAGRYDRPFDVNGDQLVNSDDLNFWITDVRQTWFGDANLDGEFNTSDLVHVFQSGHYEDGIEMKSSWVEGDWNGDGEFGSGDLVFAFQNGGFELGPRAGVVGVPEPSTATLFVVGVLGIMRRARATK